jgi:pyrroloquinoline quinone (PQQ) biosynthesis protein C
VLAQTYEYANFSTRILALTAGHFPIDKTLFATRFIQHAAEEKGHDRLLVNDAKALGYDLAKLPVLAEAEAFHKSLYFWIYQGQPVVMLGWVLCLECFAVENGPRAFERVEKAFGKKAASFLFVHAHEDPDHVAKAFETIRNLSESDLDQISHGLNLYASLYESMYRAIEREVSKTSQRKVA